MCCQLKLKISFSDMRGISESLSWRDLMGCCHYKLKCAVVICVVSVKAKTCIF